MRPHVPVEGPQCRELLPLVARDLAEKRALAVHDLVVREGQDEVLVPRVDEREGQLVVVPPPVHGLLGDVVERVVHPAHVPLEREAEPSAVGRPGDARPRRRLLRDHRDAGVRAVDDRVQLPQERRRLEVLPAAVAVRHPLAGLARVVEVEHRRDGVDPEAVGMELLEPVEGVREEEVAHLVARVVEDERPPVGVRAAPRVRVLVQRRAVEAGERPLVAREVGRHPVEQHADPVPVELVDELPQVVRLAQRRLRGEVPGHLVAPRGPVRVLHDRHQLDVREAELHHVLARARPRGRATRGPAATRRGAPRTPTSERRADSPPHVAPATRRRSRCNASGRGPTRWRAGASARNAKGSALTRDTPSAPRTASLYAWPSRAFGATPAHTPDDACGSSGSAPSLQKFQSPTTETDRAFGAHTANRAPASSSSACAPELLPEPLVAALAEQVEVELARSRHAGASSMRSSPTTGIDTQSGRFRAS